MEVHPPHAPVHSWKDFLVHMSMILLGIVIALGFEQVREHMRERELAEKARENFHREIETERPDLVRHVERMAQLRGEIQQFLDANSASRGQQRPLHLQTYWQFLRTNSWQTANATQAFSYMGYDEVQRYSVMYSSQQLFNEFEGKYLTASIELSHYMDRNNLTPQEANERDRNLRIVLGYSASIEEIGKQLITQFDEASR